MSEERWSSRVYGLLRNSEGRVLVIGSDDSPSLPSVEVEGSADDELPSVRNAFAALLGVQTIVIRPVMRAVDEAARRLEIAFELELLEPGTVSRPGTRLLAPGDLARVSLPDHERELLERLIGDRPPSQRAPWARSGWFAEATEWIEASLANVGRRTTGPVEQISTWCISSILRGPTAEGSVYFKATAGSPLFVDEGAVTRDLARLFPGNVPSPIAIDSARRWMLLDDFGPLVGWKASLETRIEVLSLYGRMQVESSRKVEEIIALGALDRRLAWLAEEIEALFDVSEAFGLEEREIEQLRTLVPTFVDACTQLAAGPVPDALVHGDLHLSNVARRDDGRYVFFDWTDACVTHPYLDMLVILFEDDPALRESLRDAYLSVWSDFAPVDELLNLWALAEPLASLNQALSYRSIFANVERGTAQELRSMLPYWLRKAIVSAGGRASAPG